MARWTLWLKEAAELGWTSPSILSVAPGNRCPSTEPAGAGLGPALPGDAPPRPRTASGGTPYDMKGGAVSELQVEIPRLRAFGAQFHTFGVGNVGQTGQATRVEAGRTSDMDGLLDLIAPAIHETALVF